MKHRTGFVILGAAAAVALIGAGCQKYPTNSEVFRDSNDRGNNTSDSRPFSKEGASNDVYESAFDLDLPENSSKAVEQDLRSVVRPIFGDIKITSFMNNFPNESSLSVEYTAKRPKEQGNLNALLSILKDKGYTIETSGVTDGNVAVSARSGDKYLIFGFKLNEQKISASFIGQSGY